MYRDTVHTEVPSRAKKEAPGEEPARSTTQAQLRDNARLLVQNFAPCVCWHAVLCSLFRLTGV